MGYEPIGLRIIETPENLERTELRDDASGFIAYVPVGSIKKGESLVRTGDSGKTVPCASCHGESLKGAGNAPPIAGRSLAMWCVSSTISRAALAPASPLS